MNSSTSSFNFILRTAALFIVLFLAYSIFIALAQPDVKAGAAQNQWQANQIAAQSYLYAPQEPETVIVGTSLAARLPFEVLPEDTANLAFNGGSPLTGLAIVSRKGAAPERVLIEANLAFQQKDDALVSQLFTPVIWRLKRFMPVLQDRHQPINVFLHYLRNRFGESEEEKLSRTVTDEELAARLPIEQAKYVDAVLIENIEDELNELRRLIAELEAKGSEIIFFTMPVDPSLVETEKYSSTRQLLETHFPNAEFLPLPLNDTYRTTDGIHLLYASALKYTEQLETWLQR